MSKIEGHAHLRRVDAVPGVILNVDEGAYQARMAAIESRRRNEQVMQKQAEEIATLQEMVQSLLKMQGVQNG